MKAQEKKQNNAKIILDSKMSQSEENRPSIFREGIIKLKYIKLHCRKSKIVKSTFYMIQFNVK